MPWKYTLQNTTFYMELSCLITIIIFGHVVIADLLNETPEYLRSHPVESECSDVSVTEREGLITSPNYPSLYSSHLSCSWHILGDADDIVTVWFDDIDIEENCVSLSQPCCVYNWLKIGPLANGTEKKVCGKNIQFRPVASSSNKLLVKFHISNFMEGGRGFQLRYRIAPKTLRECGIDEIKCTTGQCISRSLRCNGYPDCEDASDERHCASSLLPDCKTNELKCGKNQCLPADLRCNGFADCEDGSDEQFCSNRCASGRSCHTVFQCYDASKHCDGIADCADYSDELDCSLCSKDLVKCGLNSTQCYNPLTQRCDKIFHCLNGEDEKDCYSFCPGKIMCNSRRGCYPMKHRCNGVAQCEDASDEKNCVPELCNYEHGGFLCDNGRCIQEVWTCDRTDDCGDGSDERNCLRNSVLTAAVMGSLICALLLVIAISCTCRLHALRMLEHRLTSRETPLSRLSREFFFREPPPSYAVAVQGSQHHLYVENLHYGAPVHRSHRRSRRPRRSRNSITAPQLPSPSRNCVIINPDGSEVPQPETTHTSIIGESSNPISLPDSSSVIRRGSKDECIISVSAENSSVSKDTGDDKESSVQSDSTCPVIRQSSDSESLSLDTINTSIEETDSVQNADHYYCDSDSEPLVA